MESVGFQLPWEMGDPASGDGQSMSLDQRSRFAPTRSKSYLGDGRGAAGLLTIRAPADRKCLPPIQSLSSPTHQQPGFVPVPETASLTRGRFDGTPNAQAPAKNVRNKGGIDTSSERGTSTSVRSAAQRMRRHPSINDNMHGGRASLDSQRDRILHADGTKKSNGVYRHSIEIPEASDLSHGDGSVNGSSRRLARQKSYRATRHWDCHTKPAAVTGRAPGPMGQQEATRHSIDIPGADNTSNFSRTRATPSHLLDAAMRQEGQSFTKPRALNRMQSRIGSPHRTPASPAGQSVKLADAHPRPETSLGLSDHETHTFTPQMSIKEVHRVAARMKQPVRRSDSEYVVASKSPSRFCNADERTPSNLRAPADNIASSDAAVRLNLKFDSANSKSVPPSPPDEPRPHATEDEEARYRPREKARALERHFEQLFDLSPRVGPDRYEMKIHRMESIAQEKRKNLEFQELRDTLHKEVLGTKCQKPSSSVQPKGKTTFSRMLHKAADLVKGASSKSASKDPTSHHQSAGDVLLERKLEAVFRSFALFGCWQPDSMVLPQVCHGIGCVRFTKLCIAAGLMGSTMSLEDVHRIFHNHLPKDDFSGTRQLEFASFIMALSDVAKANGKSSAQVFQRVIAINQQDRLCIHS